MSPGSGPPFCKPLPCLVSRVLFRWAVVPFFSTVRRHVTAVSADCTETHTHTPGPWAHLLCQKRFIMGSAQMAHWHQYSYMWGLIVWLGIKTIKQCNYNDLVWVLVFLFHYFIVLKHGKFYIGIATWKSNKASYTFGLISISCTVFELSLQNLWASRLQHYYK